MSLNFGLFASADSTSLIADLSPFLEEAEFGNDEHGYADCRMFVPGGLFESFWFLDRAGLPHLRITDRGVLVWEGLLEDPKVVSGGVELLALGYYRALSDLPHTAAYASVTADTIVADLLNSAPLLSTSTALIQSPGVTLSESYDDELPAEILDRLCYLGDNQTPPRVWEACVWGNRMLAFRPRGDAARAWYVDVPELEVERTLQTLVNSAYGVYQDANNLRAVTATATDQPSVNRWGRTRREAVNVQTRSATLAAITRDALVEDGRNPAVRAEISVERVYDAAGAAWPGYEVQSGDTVTIRNLPPTLAVSLNRIRTFRVLQARYDSFARPDQKLKITPEAPPASILEQLSGGASGSILSASQRSSPLRRMESTIRKLKQEVHGGPGGGGGGTSGGTYLVPVGGILLFAADCPTGWTEYTAARGRAIVGVPSGGAIAGTVGSALTNLATRTISTVVAHTHAAGTLDGDNESAHTHGVGTLNNATEAAHTHGIGTYDAAAEAAHTHGVGTLNNATEAAHTHAADPPLTATGNQSVDHTHSIDPPSTTTDTESAHTHDFKGGGGGAVQVIALTTSIGTSNIAGLIGATGGHNHDINIASFASAGMSVSHTHDVNISSFTTGAGSTHDHAISGATAAGSSHDHALSGTSGAGASHDHAISGATAAGAAHGHTVSGSTASAGTATVDVTMPYIQLRLCQKD